MATRADAAGLHSKELKGESPAQGPGFAED